MTIRLLLTGLTLSLFLSACSFLAPYQITVTTPNDSVVTPSESTLDVAVTPAAYLYISGVQCDDRAPYVLLPVLTDDMQAVSAHNLSLAMLQEEEEASHCEITVSAFDQTTTATSQAKVSVYVLEKPEVEVSDGDEVLGNNDDGSISEVGPVSVGEKCGGTFGIACVDGAVCQREENAEPDAQGLCEAFVVEEEEEEVLEETEEEVVEETEVIEEETPVEEVEDETPEETPAVTEEVESEVNEVTACSESGGTWNECGSACAEGAEICTLQCVPQCEYPNS
jgi:hypothetical protein